MAHHLLAGPTVLCWKTPALDNASRMMSRFFFEHLNRKSNDFEGAFIHATQLLAVKSRRSGTVEFVLTDPVYMKQPDGGVVHKDNSTRIISHDHDARSLWDRLNSDGPVPAGVPILFSGGKTLLPEVYAKPVIRLRDGDMVKFGGDASGRFAARFEYRVHLPTGSLPSQVGVAPHTFGGTLDFSSQAVGQVAPRPATSQDVPQLISSNGGTDKDLPCEDRHVLLIGHSPEYCALSSSFRKYDKLPIGEPGEDGKVSHEQALIKFENGNLLLEVVSPRTFTFHKPYGGEYTAYIKRDSVYNPSDRAAEEEARAKAAEEEALAKAAAKETAAAKAAQEAVVAKAAEEARRAEEAAAAKAAEEAAAAKAAEQVAWGHLLNKDDSSWQFDLKGEGPFTIGRDPSVNINNNPRVSRLPASISISADRKSVHVNNNPRVSRQHASISISEMRKPMITNRAIEE
jgi:hypothetical protein